MYVFSQGWTQAYKTYKDYEHLEGSVGPLIVKKKGKKNEKK